MPDTGSGYGGKHNGDAALEAARLAKAVGQAGEAQLDARRGDDLGVLPSRRADRSRRARPRRTARSPSGSSTITTRAARGCNRRTRFRRRRSSFTSRNRRCGRARTAGWRRRRTTSCANRTWTSWRTRSKLDPLEFRLKNAKDERLRNVIVAAADKFGWKARKKTRGPRLRHRGGLREGRLRGHLRGGQRWIRDRRGEGAARGGGVRVRRHRESRAPAQSGGGRGRAWASAARCSSRSISATARSPTNRLSRYRVPRFADMPVIESVLLDRKDIVSAGAGETPIVGIAPAIGNAIFDASGKRIRRLPLMA